jgi:diaminopimelate epimerase
MSSLLSASFKISKYSGTKNSFFIIDARAKDFRKLFIEKFKLKRNQFVKSFFDPNHLGMFADGFIFIEQAEFENNDFKWDFYNKDGSSAEMCGNASRCVAVFATEKINLNKNQLKFETLAGVIETQIESASNIKVRMPNYQIYKNPLPNQIGLFVNTGVPHAVIEVEQFDFEKMRMIAKNLRKNNVFGNAGTNITFVNGFIEKGPSAITFERGVEDFTESCGTGAVAAAVYLDSRSCKPEQRIMNYSITVPGGILKIDLLSELNNETGRAFLSGEVSHHFDMEI